MRYLTLLCATFCLLFLLSCESESGNLERTLVVEEAPDYMASSNVPFNATFNIVGGTDLITLPPNVIATNLNELVHLGRVLFYDRALSANDKVSCATCHRQEFAFSDPFRHSIGVGAQLSERNTPSIVNVRFSQGLFWDQSSQNMLTLALEPIKNHREMGFSNMDALVNKLVTRSYYPELFLDAYGDAEVTPERIATAITEFCSQLNSFDSDVDLGELTDIQRHGQTLFAEKGCNDCHNVLNSADPTQLLNFAVVDMAGGSFAGEFGYTGATEIGSIANVGLNTAYEDDGVGSLNGRSEDNGKFKVPSLRNVAITAPYMHDGRFQTLDEVLDFYSEGIKPHENLDDRLRNPDGSVKLLSMTPVEKQAIKQFLKALTSKELLTNDLFSDPFSG